ncbi:MAG: polyprenyl diphosphate synthase, partial [Candidatus Cryptobacteroides sp.]
SIIMDGNGRWASERGKERYYGHIEGVESVRACTEAAVECGVKWLSLFAFSEENWGRPEKEVSFLMEMMVDCMKRELPTFMKNGVRFIVLGNRERLSDSLKATIDECMEITKSNEVLNLVIFLSYSGKWDILQAAAKYAADCIASGKEPEVPDMEVFGKYLVTDGIPDPDLIIRTSGEKRLSNYMLWQSAYSELFFDDILWPDFRKDEFRKAMEEYAKRDRRYGKVK